LSGNKLIEALPGDALVPVGKNIGGLAALYPRNVL
jgi:hypothetical protein